jgi:hypothetical protein
VAEQRYQAVLAVLQDGLSVTAVAEKMGVNGQTLHKWLAWYAGGGIESRPGLILRYQARKPQGCGADDRHQPRGSCRHQRLGLRLIV